MILEFKCSLPLERATSDSVLKVTSIMETERDPALAMTEVLSMKRGQDTRKQDPIETGNPAMSEGKSFESQTKMIDEKSYNRG